MKKFAIILCSSALVLSLGVTGALAAGPWHHSGGGRNALYDCNSNTNGGVVCSYHGTNCMYQDANGDGVCDNWGTNCTHPDSNGDGLCDLCGRSCGSQGLGNGHHGGGHHGWRN